MIKGKKELVRGGKWRRSSQEVSSVRLWMCNKGRGCLGSNNVGLKIEWEKRTMRVFREGRNVKALVRKREILSKVVQGRGKVL